jgi:hypothetical protein
MPYWMESLLKAWVTQLGLPYDITDADSFAHEIIHKRWCLARMLYFNTCSTSIQFQTHQQELELEG